MYEADLTPDQWKIMFETILTVNPTVLQEINLGGTDLRQVPPFVTGQALAAINTINLSSAKLSPHQWATLFIEILEYSPAVVEHIDLSDTDLRDVPAFVEILLRQVPTGVEALAHLKTVHLNSAKLTTDQWQDLFKAVFLIAFFDILEN